MNCKGDQLLKSLKTKLKRHLTKEVKFRTIQSGQKLSFYTNMKDQTPKLMKSYVVYQFDCPGFNDSYIGKTERNSTVAIISLSHANFNVTVTPSSCFFLSMNKSLF